MDNYKIDLEFSNETTQTLHWKSNSISEILTSLEEWLSSENHKAINITITNHSTDNYTVEIG